MTCSFAFDTILRAVHAQAAAHRYLSVMRHGPIVNASMIG
jgi:hypothetical protein